MLRTKVCESPQATNFAQSEKFSSKIGKFTYFFEGSTDPRLS